VARLILTATQWLGVAGEVEGHTVLVGRPGWLAEQ